MAKGKSTPRFEPPPDDLIKAINDRKCVVFVGAGLSQGAGFPSWPALLKGLTDRCEKDGGTTPTRIKAIRRLTESSDALKYLMAAEDLRDCIGPDKFVSLLADAFQDDSKAPTAAHEQLPLIGFRGAITTNYDKLLEYTYAKARAGRTPPTYTSNDAADLADALFKEKFFILKAHGDIEKRTTLVLTEKDYREVFYRRPGYKTALSTIFTTRCVLFLGASLSDPEMWLLLGYLHDCFHGSGTYHYALLPRGDEAETMFNRWKNDFQVQCIHYDASADHREVAEFLKLLPRA